MEHSDDVLDAIAVLALGAVPRAEADALEAHVATCEICRREYDALRDAAGLVAYGAELPHDALDDLTARRMKNRVMIAVRADLARTPARSSPPASARSAARWLPYGVAAAAVLVAAYTAFDANASRSQNDRTAARVATLEAGARTQRLAADRDAARARALEATLALVVAPGSRHFAVPRGEVVASRGRIVIALRDLPALPKGKTYQAWTLATGAKAVAPSITFAPDARGVAVVELPEAADRLAAVAVSVEPQGGSKAPTTKPAFVRALS